MRYNSLRPKRLRYEQIWEIAERFRTEYLGTSATIPVPIEEIIEFKIGLEIVPQFSLKAASDIEAFLSNDLKTIYVDSAIYSDDRYLQRLRFTLAHEIGHYVLHRDVYESLQFSGYNDWIDFINNTDEESIEWFERQAFEFAGRLMVPKVELINHVKPLKKDIEEYAEKLKKEDEFDVDFLLSGISRKICSAFMISTNVIKIRIKKEKILEELNIQLND